MDGWEQADEAIVESLSETLGMLPGIDVQEARLGADPVDRGWDGRIAVAVAGRDLCLALRIRKAVYPRDVRQDLEHLRSLSDEEGDRIAVLAAESISPGAKELLQKERVAYWDSGGSLFLMASGLYLLIDRPAPKALKRAMRTLFSGRRAQAILAILCLHEQWVRVAEVARLSGVSRPTVSQVMTELERQGFLDTRGAGPGKERRVTSPGELLDAWVAELPTLRKAQPRRFFVPGPNAGQLAERIGAELEARGVTYGLTGQAAAQRHAPFLSSSPVVALLVLQSPEFDEAVAALGGIEVDEGANLEVHATRSPDAFNFRQRADASWLLHPIQVYLALLRGGGRSQELAAHLRQERIGY